MVYRIVKRLGDFILSLIAIALLSPLFIVIAILIKLDSPGPVFFKQKRVGLHKKHFNILKFRTMRIDAPKDMPTHMLLNPEQYITKVGRFLRKTSLDELPQIINILLGQMSIIGPRPALWNQFDLIEERDKYGVNDVTPGLTGWAQVNGRDELSIEEKARMDGEYVRRMGFAIDIKCFIQTIVAVLKRKGVAEGAAGVKQAAASKEVIK
jgi:O-antigen biosynthesis protein WbqP